MVDIRRRMGLTPLLSPHGRHPEALSSVGRSACLDGGRDHRESDRVRPRVIPTGHDRQVRIRHDDRHLGQYAVHGAVIRSAMELASDVEGLRLGLATASGDRHLVRVADDGSVVGLWRSDSIPDPRRGPPLAGRASESLVTRGGYSVAVDGLASGWVAASGSDPIPDRLKIVDDATWAPGEWVMDPRSA